MPSYNGFQNGIEASRHIQTGFDNLVNVDVHTDIGSATAQIALANDITSNVPNEPCVQCTPASGTVYFFSTISGKIWKLRNGIYTTITANSNTTGHRGCIPYNGLVRYWTASKMGKFTPDTEAGRNDNFSTAANGNFNGACEENLTLFVNDGKYIASLNSSEVFNANAMDMPSQFTGTCVIPDGLTNILIGTIISMYTEKCRSFLWDTYSDSYTLSDEIEEFGINCFINCDDVILAQCGIRGKIYQWSGQGLITWDNEIRDLYTTPGWQAAIVYKSRPLIAVGNRVYSIYRANSKMPRVLVQEYTATGVITSLGMFGDALVVSIANGVNIASNTLYPNKAIATIDTPETGAINDIIVDYQLYPEGIEIWTKTNGATWTKQDAIIDSIRNKVYFNGGLLNPNFVQGRVILNPNGQVSPIITNIEAI